MPITRTTIHRLTEDYATIIRQAYVEVDGKEYPIGLPHRIAYVNNAADRARIATDLAEADHSAVLAKWGETTTMPEPGAELNT